jgi:hypothetical protein
MRGMTFGRRISGVLALNAATFEEIESNPTITAQAVGVVVLASVASGIGAGLFGGPILLVRTAVAALVGWVMWAAVTYVVGTKLLAEPGTRSDMGELLRVIGFAYAPGILGVLGFIPILGPLVRLVVAFWVLAATVIAVRQALDYTSTLRAFAVVLIGWLFFLIITMVF